MELVQNLTNAVSLALVVATFALHLRRRPSPARWRDLAAVGLPSYVVLLFTGEMLTAIMVPWFSPLSDGGMFLLAMFPATLVASAGWAALRWPPAGKVAMLAPLAGLALLASFASALFGGTGAVLFQLVAIFVVGAIVAFAARVALRGPGSLRPASPWVVGALVLLAIPSGFLEIALGLDEPQQARHAWSVEIVPEGVEGYVVRVPFLGFAGYGELEADATMGARVESALARLRPLIRIEHGEASMAWVENGSALRIEGHGRARAAGASTLYGGGHDREVTPALLDKRVDLAAGGPPLVHVVWAVRFSGGEGHSCGTVSDGRATVSAGSSATLAGPDIHTDGSMLSSFCA